MQEIGDRYKVSRERVRQILARNGLDGCGGTRIDPFRVLRMVKDYDSANEIARALGFKQAVSVLRVLHALCPMALAELEAYRHEATRERLLARLRKLAARLGYTPGKDDLDDHGPSCNSLQYVFGSLQEAQRLAGLVPTKVGGRSAKLVAA